MPAPRVHHRLTERWALEEGLDPASAKAAGIADVHVDLLWPGTRWWTRHFNPTASLFWAPYYLVRAIRDGSPTLLGYALHCKQDAIGHGLLGLAHIRARLGLLDRDPDDWALMPAQIQAAIELASRRMIRRYASAIASRVVAA